MPRVVTLSSKKLRFVLLLEQTALRPLDDDDDEYADTGRPNTRFRGVPQPPKLMLTEEPSPVKAKERKAEAKAVDREREGSISEARSWLLGLTPLTRLASSHGAPAWRPWARPSCWRAAPDPAGRARAQQFS